jgi:hypothetical protein
MKGNLSSLIHLSKKHYIMETIFPRGPAKSLLPKNNLSLLVSSSIESRIRWGIINIMQPQVIHQEPHRDLGIRMLEENLSKGEVALLQATYHPLRAFIQFNVCLKKKSQLLN